MQDRRTVELSGGEGGIPGGVFLSRFERRDKALALGTGLIAGLVYLLTCAPTVTAEDSGELAAAVWTLGIPHPPGYPLYVILGKVFVTIVPFGEVAWRLNVLSALLSGGAIALAVLLARRLSAPRGASASVALLAAFTPTVWSQATITEVYPLAAVVFLTALHLAVLYLVKPSAPRLWALAYVSGLALAAHPALVFLLPGVALLVLLGDPDLLRRAGEVAAALALSLLGFSVYLYLPLRSLADPVMDWGNPETVEGFLAHLLRLQYSGLTQPARYPVLDHVLYLGWVAVFVVGAPLVLLAALGLRSLLRFPGAGFWPRERERARRAFRAAYLAWLLLFSVGFLFVLSISFEEQTLALNRVFFLPLLLLLVPPGALGLGRVLAWGERASRGRTVYRYALRAALVLLPASFLAANYAGEDKSRYRIARDYAENVLKTLPEGAVYVPGSDHSNFPVLYLQVVEGMRPDVVTADKYGYLDPTFLRRLARSEDELRRVRRMPRAEADRWLIDRAGRPVFVNSKRTILEVSTESFQPTGLLYRVDRGREPLPEEEEDALWASYRFSNLTEEYLWRGWGQDIGADFIAVEALILRAEYHFQREEEERALECTERIGEIAGEYKEILQNTGSLLAENDHPREAAAFYERALEIHPRYAECRRNYAWVLLSAGIERERAIELAERSLEEMEPEPWFLRSLGDAYRAERRYRNARDAYLAAARLDPADWKSMLLAGEVTEEDLKRTEHAKIYFEESLRRKPTQPELIEKLHGKEARKRYEEAAAKALEGMVHEHLPPLPGDPVPADREQENATFFSEKVR